jgi:hypothetical protein
MENIMDDTYVITHNWGDPREPEYHDGLPVLFVTYREDDLHTGFKVVPHKKAGDEGTIWMVEAPARLRKSVGGNRTKCLEICNRVVEYLKTDIANTHWRGTNIPFSKVSLDTSNIPGWLSTKIAIFKDRHRKLLAHLPAATPAIILILAYFILIFGPNVFEPLISASIAYMLGCLVLIFLFIDIRNAYRAALIATSMKAITDRTFNYKWAAIEIVLGALGVRYAITISLVVPVFYLSARQA